MQISRHVFMFQENSPLHLFCWACAFSITFNFPALLESLILDIRLFAVLSRNPEAGCRLRASFFSNNLVPTLDL